MVLIGLKLLSKSRRYWPAVVAVIPDAVLPMAIGLNAPEIHSMTSFDAEFGALNPPS